MKLLVRLSLLSCFVLATAAAHAQHCAPIVESFLSRVSVQHDYKNDAIDLSVEYSKIGGRSMAKYQVYLLAYLEKNEHRIPAPPPAKFIDKEVVLILHTETIKRKAGSKYDFDLQLDTNELARKIINFAKFTKEDEQGLGSWKSFKDKFRLAVFVPFLEDRDYSVLPDLPEDKHECNYPNNRALLFQPLPYYFSIHFGTVKAVRLPEGKYHIQINQSPSMESLADEVPDEIREHMSEDEFWLLIERTREESRGDRRRQSSALDGILQKLSAAEIEAFDWHFTRLHQKANTWDLWGVVYIINGGCGDDSFHYFGTWLISRGKTIYTSCLQDPQLLANIPRAKNCFFEEFEYVAAEVYEAKFGRPLPDGRPIPDPPGPTGAAFKEDNDELKKRFPKVWKKFAEEASEPENSSEGKKTK